MRAIPYANPSPVNPAALGYRPGKTVMLHTTAHAFAYHQVLVLIAGAVCLFGTWIGMRHFARARATEGPTRHGSDEASAVIDILENDTAATDD